MRQNTRLPAGRAGTQLLSRSTCFASWPRSRVGNPRGLRDALAATQRDALAATRTDRSTAHGPRAADPTAVQLADWLLLASWSFGGLFSSFSTDVFDALDRKRAGCLLGWEGRSVNVLFCPATSRPAVCRPGLTRPSPMVCSGFGFEKWPTASSVYPPVYIDNPLFVLPGTCRR